MKDTERTPANGPRWLALKQWGDDVARIERLAGGVANDVWSVRVNGQLAVALRDLFNNISLIVDK